MKKYVFTIFVTSILMSLTPSAFAQDSGETEDFRALMISQFSNTSPTGQSDPVAEYTESYNTAYEKVESERNEKELASESNSSYSDPVAHSLSGSATDYAPRRSD